MKWLFIFVPYCVLNTNGHYQYIQDYIGRSDKIKMLDISMELLRDANLKLRQIAEIRDEHAGFKAFDIGLVMGNIREKYRTMMEIYRELRDKNNGRSLFVPSSIWELKPVHFVIGMEHIHVLETDIDKLIHMLETLVSDDLNPDPRYDPSTTTQPKNTTSQPKNSTSQPKLVGRVGDEEYNADMEILNKMAAEQELKSRNRERRLLQRLGSAGQHTSRQRFQKQWPVEDSWHLGQYGDLGVYAN